jgi:TPP-dependent pyruvate/acetoin dehydrogenase alpha subunit
MSAELAIYRKMYLMRAAEEAIVKYYPNDEMKTPMHMSMGEEAIVAGVCHALRDQDYALGTYRSHALYLGKVGETDRFFAELYGRRAGTAKGKGGSMHLSDPAKGLMLCSAIVGGTVSIGCGVALACQMKGEDKITAVFFGDGATDSGTFWESMNYASLERLPILFIHEDNDLAVHTRKERRHGHAGVEKVLGGFDIDVIVENSNDPIRIYDKTREAIYGIRSRNRPAFISARYFRYLEHVGINTDFHEKYRASHASKWIDNDPVLAQRARLISRSITAVSDLETIEREIREDVEASVMRARTGAFADVSELHTDVFV